MRIIDGYRPQKLQVWLASPSGSQRWSELSKYCVATVPDESSPRPPRETTSPLPSTVAEGYQEPPDMSLTLVYAMVSGSKTNESRSPL
nr:hypothetical protein GCM10020092_060820 [Actinoplanes digitatis]